MVSRADHAFLFHLLDESRGAVITDLQAALNIACRGFAVLNDDGEADDLMRWLKINHESPLLINKCRADNQGVRIERSCGTSVKNN